MSSEMVNSWIFLAVAMASQKSPTPLDGIIGVADGINHAIPTHKELQNAFGWLSKQGLILKKGKKYQLTEKGLILYKEANEKSKSIFGLRDYLENEFSKLPSEISIDSLTDEEADAAYNKYKERYKEYNRRNKSKS